MRERFSEIIGSSTHMQRVYDLIERIAPLTTTVLILGETGTGKELVARAIHQRSKRALKSFVKVDCTALPHTLLESELFGYKRGAFTDARFDKPGKFELADKGTLFLDEIGELPLPIQAKLLRVLEENTFEPLGAVASVRVDVRIVTATNRDLDHAVRTSQFRKDLFYRLNVFPVVMPDLKDRLDDLPLLINHFIDRFNDRFSKKIKGVTGQVERLFGRLSWPGNVRQLRHVLEFACINCTGSKITMDHLPDDIRGATRILNGSSIPDDPFAQAESEIIKTYLHRFNNSRNKTAKALGISRVSLWRKMKKYGYI